MLPYKTLIRLNRKARTPLYLQISNECIKKITVGIISTGLKLPGSRKMSELLKVSRRTVGMAYEELEAQGWIEIIPNKGCFISSKIPVTKTQGLNRTIKFAPKEVSLFPLNKKLDFLTHHSPSKTKGITHVFDTGYPDVRLVPLKDLSRNFSSVLHAKRNKKILNYAYDFNGNIQLRKELVKYLSETRGINISIDNIIITRGSLMAFSNLFQVLLEADDIVVVGDVSFKVANNIIRIAQGKLLKVSVDEFGINVDQIEKICKKQKIRAVFVMPHHHHPTTVSLCAERRMKLLMLAETYRFAIIEDDYDYDFHYSSSPILPMASADSNGVVVYVGSFSKTVAPGLRIGFIVAPKNLIRDLSRLSRFMDCHGNIALEQTIAVLFREGIIRRHMKKALKIYKERRNYFCELLEKELGEYLSFQIPEGGLAVWVKFNDSIPVEKLRTVAFQKSLMISKSVFTNANGKNINAIRMGFASMNKRELKKGVGILKAAILEMVIVH